MTLVFHEAKYNSVYSFNLVLSEMDFSK